MPTSRPIIIAGDHALVQLSKGLIAIIDAEDANKVTGLNWTAMSVGRTNYARRNVTAEDGRQKSILLHRVVMNAPQGINVDHRDGDGLNCRKSNLRLATQQQNCCNTRPRASASGIKGVRKHNLCDRYVSSISANGKRYHLGMFATAEEAAAAYAAASAELHQQFGRTA